MSSSASVKKGSWLRRSLRRIGLSRHDSEPNEVVIDTNVLESHLDQDSRMRLYHKAMQRANVEWSDSFLKQCRFDSLQQTVEIVLRKGLTGDFAECGCWKGHSTYIISAILTSHGFSNRFHVFDSFEGGLSDKSPQDENKLYAETSESIAQQKRVFASNKDKVQATLAEFPFVELYEGWIPDRFNEVEDRRFSFVHIDVDLYQPTLDSLEFFYPRLDAGGLVVVDDYGFSAFPGAKRAVDEFLQQNDYAMFYEIPTGGAFIVK
jgi:O-methyltransferase